MSDEVGEQLARMRKAMGKLAREGREREFEAVAVAYAELKRQQMEAAEVEAREAARARVAERRAQEGRERSRRWRLPRGFGTSPLAQQRAAAGLGREPMVPDTRRPALNPWRRVHPMEEVLWRPGR